MIELKLIDTAGRASGERGSKIRASNIDGKFGAVRSGTAKSSEAWASSKAKLGPSAHSNLPSDVIQTMSWCAGVIYALSEPARWRWRSIRAGANWNANGYWWNPGLWRPRNRHWGAQDAQRAELMFSSARWWDETNRWFNSRTNSGLMAAHIFRMDWYFLN